MNDRAASLHQIAPARGKARSMRVHGPLLAAVLLALLAGCATGPEVCTTRTEIQRFPQPVFIDLPQRFIEPLEIPPLEAPVQNETAEDDIQALEDVIDRANADRAELERLQEQRKQREADQ